MIYLRLAFSSAHLNVDYFRCVYDVDTFVGDMHGYLSVIFFIYVYIYISCI